LLRKALTTDDWKIGLVRWLALFSAWIDAKLDKRTGTALERRHFVRQLHASKVPLVRSAGNFFFYLRRMTAGKTFMGNTIASHGSSSLLRTSRAVTWIMNGNGLCASGTLLQLTFDKFYEGQPSEKLTPTAFIALLTSLGLEI
jgi:hypothetical protein